MTGNGNTVTSSSALATTTANDTTAEDYDDEDEEIFLVFLCSKTCSLLFSCMFMCRC